MSYTITDIAQHAGVSKSTVSRYIKGERNKISASTQAVIAKVIEELDYRPNQIAVGLARKRLPMVGVVVSDITNPFSSVVMKGIFDACDEREQSMSFAISNGSASRERNNIKNFMTFSIDRLIIQSCGDNDEFLDQLDPEKTVIIDRPLKKQRFHTITSDNYESTVNAIRHLQFNVCTPIALLTPDINSVTTRAIRYQGYQDAIRGKQEPIVVSFDSRLQASKKLEQLFAGDAQPKGVFTSNGEALKVFLNFAKTHHIHIGHEVGVVAFEDWDWMEFLNPPVTAVKQNSYEMGYVAAKDLLDGELRVGTPETTIIQSELVVRDSALLRR